MTEYAELVAASNFSFLRGASHPEELAGRATELGYKALAICDRNTVAGVVRAHKPAKALGLKYIPGCRLVLQEGFEIAYLPTNRDAWGRLCQLLTIGNRRATKGECFLWLDDLIRHGEGQILIFLPPADGPCQPFAETAGTLAGRFPGQVYIGAALAFDGRDGRKLAHLAKLGQETGAPMVAVGDCLYHAPERKPLQDVLTCIRAKCAIRASWLPVAAKCRTPSEILRRNRSPLSGLPGRRQPHRGHRRALHLLAGRTDI
jgi:error-prone DNA polymerase